MPPPFVGHRGLDHFRQKGTTPECWYYANVVNRFTLEAVAAGINRIYAFPFASCMGGTIAKISFRVTIGAKGAKARIGIYESTSDTNLYPSNLVVDGGEKDASLIETKISNVNVTLNEDKLYYFVYICGVLAPTVRAVPIGNAYPMFGADATLGTLQRTHWRVVFPYAPLPATYPVGGTLGNGAFPAIACLFAA